MVASIWASRSPVIFEATGGVMRVFRVRAASIPCSAYVFRAWLTVVLETPNMSAASWLLKETKALYGITYSLQCLILNL